MKIYYLHTKPGLFYYFQKGKKFGYRYTYYIGTNYGKKRHETSRRGFKTLAQAGQALREFKARRSAIKNYSNLTLKQWCVIFLKNLKVECSPKVDNHKSITTYKSYYQALTNHIIPKIGNIKLVDLKPLAYKYKCVTPMINSGLSHKTVLNVNSRFQAVINRAVRYMLLPKNNFTDIDIPREHVNPQRAIFNNKQLKTFNHNLRTMHSPRVQIIYFMLEYTGMRAGELLGLRWKDVDLASRTIHIRHTRDGYGLRRPKTRSSQRNIIITTRLNVMLYRYYSYCQKKFHATHQSFVIVGMHGKPLIPMVVPTVLRKLLKECGFKKLVGRFTPHSFRHMFASRLIRNGVDPITVSKILGHSNPDITLKMYAQASPHYTPNIETAIKKAEQRMKQ